MGLEWLDRSREAARQDNRFSAFVLGIAAMFTPLGVVAGYTGSIFGSALSNPWVLAFVALVCSLAATPSAL